MIQNVLAEYDSKIRMEELLTFCMAFLLNTLIIIFSQITLAPIIFTINVIIMLTIIATVFAQRFAKASLFTVYRDWYTLFFLITIYMQHNKLVPLVNPHDIDAYLMKIDYALFLGNHPTVLLESILNPYFTEFLQIIYASFYFFPFLLCLLLYRNKRKADFHIVASTILLGFYISYIGYYLFPAIGPRFTMVHLQTLPLEGVYLYNFFHHAILFLGGVTRDCFPSGHTLVSILTFMLTVKYFKKFSIVAGIWMVFLVMSTVYLRYHYVIDLIAGFILCLAVYKYGPMLARVYIFGRLDAPSPMFKVLRDWVYFLLNTIRR